MDITNTGVLSNSADHLWGLALAGGEGIRLQGFIKKIYGVVHPKQYCAITGTRSMLRHTIDRARMLIARDQLYTIVNGSHLHYVREQLNDQPDRTVIVQPCSRETGPAILLSLLHIYHRDPQSVIALFPSDHFVLNERRFMEHISAAYMFVRMHPKQSVLLGVKPDRAEDEYGWIEPGEKTFSQGSSVLHSIKGFLEKPGSAIAEALHRNGALWNTLVLVGKVESMLLQFQKLMPEVFSPLQKIWRVLDTDLQHDIVGEVFQKLPSVNFSRAILERSHHLYTVMPLTDVYWSDWGNEPQILKDIEQFSLRQRGRSAAQRKSYLRPAAQLDHLAIAPSG